MCQSDYLKYNIQTCVDSLDGAFAWLVSIKMSLNTDANATRPVGFGLWAHI